MEEKIGKSFVIDSPTFKGVRYKYIGEDQNLIKLERDDGVKVHVEPEWFKERKIQWLG